MVVIHFVLGAICLLFLLVAFACVADITLHYMKKSGG